MKTQGVRVFDVVLQTSQLDWLVIAARECPDRAAERRVTNRHFRVPHEAWGTVRAFVQPVTIRRSRRRVLFRQKSGLTL